MSKSLRDIKDSVPPNIEKLLNNLAYEFSELLENNFVGFYVHGSIAMNCFNTQESDIDFLVVVKSEISQQIKRKIIDILIEATKKAPPKGLEVSIIGQSVLDDFKHPTPFLLHFSNSHIEKYKSDPSYICGDDEDTDLAAHLVITKAHGICLLGKPIDEVFPEIPTKYYLNSIVEDSQWSLDNIANGENTGSCHVPVYAVLNLCRVIAYIQDKKITSKREGGEWGLVNLPEKYQDLFQEALNKYSSKPTKKVDAKLLKDFGVYSKAILDSSVSK